MFMYYIVCYFTGIFYAVVRQISVLFIDYKDSVDTTDAFFFVYGKRNIVPISPGVLGMWSWRILV